MPDFMDEAKKLAGDHPDVANKGLDEAAQAAKDKSGGRFDNQIDQGEQRAEGYLGADNQAAEDPNQQPPN